MIRARRARARDHRRIKAFLARRTMDDPFITRRMVRRPMPNHHILEEIKEAVWVSESTQEIPEAIQEESPLVPEAFRVSIQDIPEAIQEESCLVTEGFWVSEESLHEIPEEIQEERFLVPETFGVSESIQDIPKMNCLQQVSHVVSEQVSMAFNCLCNNIFVLLLCLFVYIWMERPGLKLKKFIIKCFHSLLLSFRKRFSFSRV
jgi:vacuolar-type H+-ATPase subunit H